MGQGQSSSADGASAQDVKTSYYTLLGVERHATDDEIKRAYRRKALELHPDRNYGNEEAATRTFAEIQSAYEVLSDAQERAWYDSHESTILRGDNPNEQGAVPTYQNVKITTADELMAIVGKFNRNVEFSDSPSGFFGFLRDTFEHLAREEEIAADMEGTDLREYPPFGHKDDQYADVVKKFYAAWSGFATVKSYSWQDKWRLSEAPDRFIRRRMEQENLKARKDGRDDFNMAVRTLVQFVKKRDPRVVVDTRTDDERQQALREATEAQRRRAREANAAKMNDVVPEWTQSREPDEYAELEGTFSESEEEEEIFECVACNKIFKSENQMDAHERSKKHQKAIKDLQKRMKKQNANLGLDVSATTSGVATPEAEEQDDEAVEVETRVEEVSLVEAPEDITEEPDHQEENGAEPRPLESVEQSEPQSEDEDYASRAEIEARLASTTLESSDDDDTKPKQAKKKMGKAAQKRAKRAAAVATDEQAAETTHKCSGCADEFSSRSKLFDHLKLHPEHVGPKTVPSGKGKKQKGKR
jgi:DnaJ family protein A protein 5